jgi:hypothetical protein
MTSFRSFPMMTKVLATVGVSSARTAKLAARTAKLAADREALEVVVVAVPKQADEANARGRVLIAEVREVVDRGCENEKLVAVPVPVPTTLSPTVPLRSEFNIAMDFKTLYNFKQENVDSVDSRTESFKADFPRILPLLNDTDWTEITLSQSLHSFKVYAKWIGKNCLLAKPSIIYKVWEWEQIFGRGGKFGFAVLKM